MVAAIREGGAAPSSPRLLFEGDYVITGPALDMDVSPDGSRFLMIRSSENEVPRRQIEVSLHWGDELRRLASHP
jgi:hypothetical protein